MTDYSEHTNEQISVQVEKYTLRLAYTAEGFVEYIGLALPGASETAAVWQIRKLEYTGTNATSVIFAEGNTNFTNIWNNHSLLSYS